MRACRLNRRFLRAQKVQPLPQPLSFVSTRLVHGFLNLRRRWSWVFSIPFPFPSALVLFVADADSSSSASPNCNKLSFEDTSRHRRRRSLLTSVCAVPLDCSTSASSSSSSSSPLVASMIVSTVDIDVAIEPGSKPECVARVGSPAEILPQVSCCSGGSVVSGSAPLDLTTRRAMRTA